MALQQMSERKGGKQWWQTKKTAPLRQEKLQSICRCISLLILYLMGDKNQTLKRETGHF